MGKKKNVDSMIVYSDANWAGDRESRRSTTGVVEMIGAHCIDSASCTQSTIALSTGEAEFYGVVKGSGSGL